jgi:GH24 family phage-related lysozyme (muramidase)
LLKSQLFKELKKNSSKEIICKELRRWVYSCGKKSKKLAAIRELECKMIYENLELKLKF